MFYLSSGLLCADADMQDFRVAFGCGGFFFVDLLFWRVSAWAGPEYGCSPNVSFSIQKNGNKKAGSKPAFFIEYIF